MTMNLRWMLGVGCWVSGCLIMETQVLMATTASGPMPIVVQEKTAEPKTSEEKPAATKAEKKPAKTSPAASTAVKSESQQADAKKNQPKSSDVKQDSAKKPPIKPTLPQAWADQAKWRAIGPASMSGRITAVAVDEKNPSKWWAATASGGLLKTVNNGNTFEHQFDDQTTVSIGDVQVAPSNTDIVWVGTGESNPRNSVSWGDGVYKSVDGGKTWKNMGLKETFQTGAIAIHPENPDVVWVGSLGRLWGPNPDRGLYKTVDGGKTWKKVLFVDDKTGVIDVQINPKNPVELLVATYERKRDGFDGNDPVQRFGAGSGIYKSVDGGESFKKITQGLPSCKLGRIGLDYFHADPKFVVAIIESEKIAKQPESAPFMGIRAESADVGAKLTTVTKDSPADKAGLKAGDIIVSIENVVVMSYEDMLGETRKHKAGDTVELIVSRDRERVAVEVELGKLPEAMMKRQQTPFDGTLGGQAENMQDQQGPDGHEYGGIYLSEDGGSSWKRINSLNPRPMYYSNIQFDPVDRNNIYVCGTNLYRSSDGGKTFKGDGGSDGIHVDHHALWIDPSNPQRMILGNDGGIHLTYDRMEHWDHLNHVAIGQFYHVGIDHTRDYKVYGGLQDNGSWGGPSRGAHGEGPINSDWFNVGGGDGFVTQVDPNDPEQIYYESQNGGMGRVHLGTGERGFIRPSERGQRFRFNWKTPYILSPHNSQIHYSVGNYVFRSLNKGSNAKRFSPEITNSDDGSGSAISESPIEPGLIYAGTTDGAVWKTADGGVTWEALFYSPVEKPKTKKEGEAKDKSAAVAESKGEGEEAEMPAGAEAKELSKDKPEEKSPAEQTPSETDPLSGSWEATIENENLPGGRLTFTMDIKKDEKNGLSGLISSPQGDSDITSGQFNPVDQQIELEATNEQMTFELTGTMSGDELSGTVSIVGADLELDFSAKKIKQDLPAQDRPAAEMKTEAAEKVEDAAVSEKSSSEKSSSEKSSAEAKQQETAEEKKSSAKPDLVSGRYNGKLTSPRGDQDVSLELKLGEKNSVTGNFESQRGDREITSGSYDAESKNLVLMMESEQFTLEFTGALADGKYVGEADINGGAFSMTFDFARAAAGDSASQESSGSGSASSAKPADAKPPKVVYQSPTGDKTLSGLLPGPRWVSSIEASRFKKDRCYITFDGHRSNDDGVHVFVTNDGGKSWASLKNNLPDSAGSVHVLREDIKNENLLYLGCEFSAWYSIDAGKTWTRIKGGLPTVAVHDFAIHPTAGEVVAATHGRSLWIGDVSVLRQLSEKTLASDAFLYSPAEAILWRTQPSRGASGTRRFVGTNPDRGTKIAYSLGKNAGSVSLAVHDLQGDVIKTLEAPRSAGLHVLDWRLDRDAAGSGQRFGRGVGEGNYLVVLKVDGERKSRVVSVVPEPVKKN